MSSLNHRLRGCMDGVVTWFERRGQIPLAPPPGVREYGPLTDDPERPGDHYFIDTIRGVAFAIEYCDAHGWMSTRTIRCLSIDQRHPACITAYCHVRETIKTFRVDRIISLIDLRSGRLLSSDEHFALLAPYLPEEQDRSYLHDLFELQNATKDGVFALLQLAMTDGRLSDELRDVVLEYVKTEAAAGKLPMPSFELVELWIDNVAPQLAAVVASITNLLAQRDKFVRLLPWVLKLVKNQTSNAVPEESVRELIAEVRQHFRLKLVEWPRDIRATS